MSDSLRPHGLYSPWNSPGQNTGVGSLSLSRGSKPRSPALQADSLPAEPPGKPIPLHIVNVSLLWTLSFLKPTSTQCRISKPVSWTLMSLNDANSDVPGHGGLCSVCLVWSHVFLSGTLGYPHTPSLRFLALGSDFPGKEVLFSCPLGGQMSHWVWAWQMVHSSKNGDRYPRGKSAESPETCSEHKQN